LTDSEFATLQGLKDIDEGKYTWRKLSEEEERPLQREHVLQSIERMADEDTSKGGRGGRGGKGGRGGRGGRGGKGGRDNTRNKEKEAQKVIIKPAEKENGKAPAGEMDVDPITGLKRKREEEEGSATKKARVE
jgi:lupus La protein